MRSEPSLDSIRFEATGFTYQGEIEGSRIWHSPEGDGIGLFLFPIPPDLPENAATFDEFKDRLWKALGDSQAKLVQIGIPVINDCPAVEQIVKIRQEPHGFTYVGSIIIPFEEFSFVLKVQCLEYGTAGVREAVLMARAVQNGTVSLTLTENESVTIAGEWNPDDERHDSTFPDHPLSRVRRILSEVTASLQIDSAVKRHPGFPLPFTKPN
jgi:hypothetical protein